MQDCPAPADSVILRIRPSQEKIRTLVYLAAYLSPIGDTTPLALSKDGWARNSESPSLPYIEVNHEAGWDMLQRQAFREVLYADCPDEDVELADALLTPEPRGPQSPSNSRIRTTPENFGRIRRIYIELTQDQAVSWPAQKRMYEATPCERVLTIHSSHSAYFSHPDQLKKHILSAGGD